MFKVRFEGCRLAKKVASPVARSFFSKQCVVFTVVQRVVWICLQGNALVLLGRTGRGNGIKHVLISAGDSLSVITIGRCDAGSSSDAAFALALCDQVLIFSELLGCSLGLGEKLNPY